MDGLSVDWGSGGPWLPAYGLIGDGGLFLPPQCALLETILEEENECEESDSSASLSSDGEEEEEDSSSGSGSGSPRGGGAYSDWGGWGGSSGSDVQSVIHVEPNSDLNDEGNDSGSERDFVCPPKRRRRDDIPSHPADNELDTTSLQNYCQSDEETRSFTSLSRSSSLLQFESLERQLLQSCDSLQQCGTDAIDGFIVNNAASSLIAGEKASPLVVTSDSDSELSDATVHSKTVDDLAPLHEVTKVIQQRSVENLSEDSGYCDGTCNIVRLAKAKSIPCFNKYGIAAYNNCAANRVVDFTGHFGAEGRYRRRCRSFDDVAAESDDITRTPDVNIDVAPDQRTRQRQSKIVASSMSAATTASKIKNKRSVISASSPCLLGGHRAFCELNTADVLRASLRRRDFNRDLDRLHLVDNTYRRLHEVDDQRYHLEDSVRVSSVPEDLNLCSTNGDVQCDWSLFADTTNTIAAKNFDLYDFADTSRSRDAGRANAFTTSCADLTALDYADIRSPRGCFNTKMASARRSASIPKANKSLFDEISEHFDKNLSILTDREVNSTFTNVSITNKRSRVSSTTFDIDPTNLVTSYAESLERCTFALDSYENSTASSIDTKTQFCDSAVFFHSTPMKRELVVSTPNLNSACAESDRFIGKAYKDDLRASMQHVPIKDEPTEPRPGILGSKHQSSTSIGTAKGVHFCPIVSEVSWRERSYSEDTQRSDSYSGSYSSEEECTNSLEAARNISRVCDRIPSPLPTSIYLPASSISVPSQTITETHVTLTIRDYKSVTEDPRFVLIQPSDMPIATESGRTSTNAGRAHTNSGAPSMREQITTNASSTRAAIAFDSTRSCNNNSVNNNRNQMETNTVTAKMSTAFRKPPKKPGFLARFASFRFSTRKKNTENKVKNTRDAQVLAKPQSQQVLNNVNMGESDYIYIPLKGPYATETTDGVQPQYKQNARDSTPPAGVGGVSVVSNKPPLPRQPPRVVGVCAKRTKTEQAHTQGRTNFSYNGGNSMRNDIDPALSSAVSLVRPSSNNSSAADNFEHGVPRGRTMARMVGLIETDLDTHETVVCNGKARSLIDLGETHHHGINRHNPLQPQTAPNSELPRPHKSMEFLLDKENHKEALPPENELQKTSSTSMSEHQLRVQRSLQRLDLPDWYRQSQLPREGFLLRKRSSPDAPVAPSAVRWTGLNSKTTSLNSLARNQTNGAVNSAHGGYLLSPSGHRDFCRWSTSKLNSSQTSPSSSVRSSFSSRTTGPVITNNGAASLRGSFRQPYLGWRSQEKLSRPRTPAERLAGSILPQQQQHQQHHNNNDTTQTPEIQSSIKEVTSAIVHYVTDAHSRLQQQGGGGAASDMHLSANRPPSSQSDSYGRRSRSSSPSQRFCWLESSFVGTRPLDSPQTPVITKAFDNSIRERRDSGLKLELRRPIGERLNNGKL